MIAFEVQLNGKKICTAGVGELGVLSSVLTWRGAQPYKKGGPSIAEILDLNVGALADSGEHLRWVNRKLKRGDMITIKVVEVPCVDKPRQRERLDPIKDLRSRKQYVRNMAKEFGWKIQK